MSIVKMYKSNYSDHVPLELIEDILSRLPVKSLKRFRCVSKTWCSLIDSPKFVKPHLHRSLASDSRHLILRDNQKIISSINLGLSDNFHIFKHSHDLVQSNTSIWLSSTEISCNGLILQCSMNRVPPALWNPFTGEYKVLNGSATGNYHLSIFTFQKYGFWYDSVNDDYKVLRLLEEYITPPRRYMAEIYSLKLDSWKIIDDFALLNGQIGDPFILVSQALHTLGNLGTSEIMAWNVETGKHYNMMMPPEMRPYILVNVYGLDGCLCLVYYYHGTDVTDNFDVEIWVMKDYGIIDSWFKLLRINNIIHTDRHVKPLGYSRDRSKVLLFGGNQDELFWYDLSLSKKTVLDVSVHSIFPELIIESLVSLGTKEDSRMCIKEDLKKKESLELAQLFF